MTEARLTLASPPQFRLRPTVRSHGWSDLAPFATDPRGEELTVRFLLDGAGPVAATVRQVRGGPRATVASARPLSRTARRGAALVLGSCLRFDLDLAPFWGICRGDPALTWAARERAGRFLRAPTAFADAALVLATTNCSWALTRRIASGLVDRWGIEGTFPTQAAIAGATQAQLRTHGRLGYRAPYLRALARGPDLAWTRRMRAPADQLRRMLLELPGFGPYAAENLMRLLGRFEHLALDSWVARRWGDLFGGERVSIEAAERRLARYGPWRGLALWLLLTKSWHLSESWTDIL
ncbi:MAG: DNA-3-methyladenine glycosylase family protein [Planctomycetaceae bacterium]